MSPTFSSGLLTRKQEHAHSFAQLHAQSCNTIELVPGGGGFGSPSMRRKPFARRLVAAMATGDPGVHAGADLLQTWVTLEQGSTTLGLP